MDTTSYQSFTAQLTARLAECVDVLGLVAVGSMAERETQPDQWSDHDFFLIVRPGAQEHFRNRVHWLPCSDEIVWSFRETEHGVKTIYRDGHLLEYAVFSRKELDLAKTNRYRVLLDRADIDRRMVEIEAETTEWAIGSSDEFHAGQFLTNLLVGLGRHRRGEVLSAHSFVKGNAVQHLLRLLARHASPIKPELADNIDPSRRFEFVFPDLGKELNDLLLQPVPEAAAGMLVIYKRLLSPALPQVPEEILETIGNEL